MDDGVWAKIFSAAAGVWALVAMAAVALFKSWPLIMGQFNERRRDNAVERASDWDRRTVEIDRLHALLANREKLLSDRDDENDALKAENALLLARAVTAEATLLGLGNARQREAHSTAVTRLPDSPKTNGNGGGK